MGRKLVIILTGIILLVVFIYSGIPFEIENGNTDAIFRTISFIFIFIFTFFLFRTVRKMKNNVIRIPLFTILGMFTLLFIIGCLWNDILRDNPRGNWYNINIYTNSVGTKIYGQMRETSGSIYDYRYRIKIYEFDENNCISINTKPNYYNGPWTVLNLKTNTTQKLNEIE